MRNCYGQSSPEEAPHPFAETDDGRLVLPCQRLRLLCRVEPHARRGKICPLPSWERATQTAQQKEWVRGPPHPIKLVGKVSLPSPTRGEGKFFGACACCT